MAVYELLSNALRANGEVNWYDNKLVALLVINGILLLIYLLLYSIKEPILLEAYALCVTDKSSSKIDIIQASKQR